MVAEPDLPAWMDVEKARRIVRLRGLGYSQGEIADEIGVSQQTVSRYLTTINELAQDTEDLDAFFAGLILGGIGAMMLLRMLDEREGP